MTLEFVDTLDHDGQNPQTLQEVGNFMASIFSAAAQYPAAIFLFGLILLALLTRVWSGLNSGTKPSPDGALTPPSAPYWLPLFGHIPHMALDAENFIRSLRSTYTNGIFSLNFAGTRHSILYTPGLATALLNTPQSNADAEGVGKHLVVNVFGFPKRELATYDAALLELGALYKLLLSEPNLGQMVEQTARKIRENVVNLVSFNRSAVDQMQWEKTSRVRVAMDGNGAEVVEASLLPLIRDFCAFGANETLMGSDFLANYPEFFDDLWVMDNAFLLLATGLPRWVPIPALTRAHIARRRNLERLNAFHEATEMWSKGDDPGTKWSSLDDVGALIKARLPVYQKYNLSIRARAATENVLMWAANANSNSLIFWMVNHVYEDRALLAMIREEIAPYVQVEQANSDGLPIADPPMITHLDIEGLCAKCPLLKSVYVECLRLDTASWSLKVVQQDFALQSREKDSPSWLLRKGDFVHAAHDLHNTNPAYFENPMVFKADRHIRYDEKSRASADMGSIRPYGGGHSMCKGRSFAFKETMIFTAAIVSMWEIEPAGGGQWKMPKHKKASGVYSTSDETRVWVKRRKMNEDGRRV